MIYGYARVSTDGQSVTAQVAELRKHGAGKVFGEVASGAKTDRAQLRRVLDQLDAGDVLMVTRLDRLARSTRDLLNTLATAVCSAEAHSVRATAQPTSSLVPRAANRPQFIALSPQPTISRLDPQC
jgi:predicted site-specific integrase-resolvase